MVKKQKKQINAELPEATLDAVRRSASKLAKPHGLEVHDVRFGPTDFGLTLSVVIKPEGGGKSAVSVTDCEVVSRPLSKELDDLMEDFPHNYLFEVTSVGISEDEEVSLDEQ
jgi:ribosome maturation factor RimP